MAIPWGFVNLHQSDHFHLLPNAGGVALYCGNKRSADGMTPEQERRIYSGDRYQDSIETWAREEYETAMRSQGRTPDTDPMAISRFWTQRTFDEIKAAPGTWFRLMARKTWLTFWNAEVPNNKAFSFLQQDYLWLRILPVRWVVLLAFAPAGIWLAFRRGNRDALPILLAYAGLYSAANILFFICDRYRYPIWPAAAIFAGGGLAYLLFAIRDLQFAIHHSSVPSGLEPPPCSWSRSPCPIGSRPNFPIFLAIITSARLPGMKRAISRKPLTIST
jgi:hypothetical protein